MRKEGCAVLTEVRWEEVRDEVLRVNPEFALIIDEVKTKNDFPLYKISYPYGSLIIESGQFHVPLSDGRLAAVTSKEAPSTIRQALDYNAGSIPLGLVLNRSVELFFQAEDRVIPSRMTGAGRLVGLWGALSPVHVWMDPWHMTAGARSTFVLPKITDATGHKKMCRARGIKMPLPRELSTHWTLLSKLAQHVEFAQPWMAEILFFSKPWFVEQKNEGWLRFHHFLYQKAWVSTEYWRRKVIYDHIWDTTICQLMKSDTKAIPFIVDMVKYITMVGLGAVPGFSPAINDDEVPLQGLQKDFIQLYGLKNYAPTIMVPRHFSAKYQRPVYWSLVMPTHLASSVKPKKLTSTLVTLREIRELMLYFKQTILKNPDSIKNSPIEHFLTKVKFDFFHSEPDSQGEIQLSLEMPKGDSTLTYCSTKSGRRGFSDVSPFVRGCVRFSN